VKPRFVAAAMVAVKLIAVVADEVAVLMFHVEDEVGIASVTAVVVAVGSVAAFAVLAVTAAVEGDLLLWVLKLGYGVVTQCRSSAPVAPVAEPHNSPSSETERRNDLEANELTA